MTIRGIRDVEERVRAAATQVVVTRTGDPSGSIRRRSVRMRRARKLRRAGAGVVMGALVGVGVTFGTGGGGAAQQIVITGDPPGPSAPGSAVSGRPPTPTAPPGISGRSPTATAPSTPPPSAAAPATAFGDAPGTAPVTATSRPPLEGKFVPPPPVVSVPGFDFTRIAVVVKECLIAEQPPTIGAGAVLRAVATDAWGLTALITTSSGWMECDLLSDGTVDSPPMFRTYASTDGWATPTISRLDPTAKLAPTDAPDDWLTAPVDLLSEGSGVLGYAANKYSEQATPYLTTVVGRADSSVAVVMVTMPTGSVAKVAVHNGMWVARMVTTAVPPYRPKQPQGLRGYDAAGEVVYASPAASPISAAAPAPCWITPDGAALTPASAGQACRLAIPWG